MGMGEALRIIEELASCGVFLERELNKIGISRNWLPLAKTMGCATPRGYGVWSHPSYEPTRYELVQLRFPHVVFWGPSALWLLGQRPREPDALFIAIDNKGRPPRRLDLSTVILRTRRLEHDVVSVHLAGQRVALRVHNRERAEADLARADAAQLVSGTMDRVRFSIDRGGCLLSSDLLRPWYRPEDWPAAIAALQATRKPKPARSHSGSMTLPSPPRR